MSVVVVAGKAMVEVQGCVVCGVSFLFDAGYNSEGRLKWTVLMVTLGTRRHGDEDLVYAYADDYIDAQLT